MPSLHEKAVEYARHCIGVKEVPMGSNHGPIQRTHPPAGVDFFQEHDFLNGGGYPWCVSFAQTCWAEAGKPLPYKTAGAYNLYSWAQKAGWARNHDQCIAGDIIVYNIGSGHAGILESFAGTSIVSIDGNWLSQVMRVTHNTWQVRGGVHIPEAYKPIVVPKPYWVITTDVNGKKVIVFSKFATEKTILGLIPRLILKYGRNGFTIKKGGVRKK